VIHADLPGIIVASVAVLGMAASVTALFYRVGRLVGKVEAAMTQGSEADARLEREILAVKAGLDAHIALHRRRGWLR
jgi:hypothetical protein